MSNRRKSSSKQSSPCSSLKKSPRRVRDTSAEVTDVSASGKKTVSNSTHPNSNGKSRTVPLSATVPVIDPILHELLGTEPTPPLPSAEEKECSASVRIEEAKEALGKLEGEIISALFPATGLPESVDAIATRLGMSVKEVQDVADNALRGLRGTKSLRPRLSAIWN